MLGIAFAQTFEDYAFDFGILLGNASRVLIGVAVVFFAWGIVKYVSAGGDEKRKSEARELLLWGVIAITVMFSVWGIIEILQGIFFGGGGPGNPPIPRSDPGNILP